MDNKYYKFSGKVSPSYIALFVGGLLAVAVLSFLYALGMYYMPMVYLCILISGAYAFAVSFIAKKMAEWGKSRNRALWAVTLISFFAVFVYVHFTAYAAIVFTDSGIIDMEYFWFLLTNPGGDDWYFGTYYLYSEIIVPYGVWSWGNSVTTNADTVNGAFLVFIWVVEHLLVLLATVAFPSAYSRPFFEETGRWGVERNYDIAWEHQPKTAFNGIRQAFETENSDFFRDMAPTDPNEAKRCQLTCFADPYNEQERLVLNLVNIQTTIDKKGNAKTSTQRIVKLIYASETFLRRLDAFAAEAREAADKAAAESESAGAEEQEDTGYDIQAPAGVNAKDPGGDDGFDDNDDGYDDEEEDE